MPECGLCGFPRVVPLVGLVHVPWFGFFAGYPWLLLPGCGQGYGLVLLCLGFGFGSMWLVFLLACM